MTDLSYTGHGLDPDHIRDVCRTANDESPTVTYVSGPPRMFVDTRDRDGALEALHHVGYSVSRHGSLTVFGWSPGRLRVRVACLTGILDRISAGLPVTVERAIDAYAPHLDRAHPIRDRAARERAADTARMFLRREVDTLTGPRAARDASIRPSEPQIATLLADVRRLELAIDRQLALHDTAAGYAVAAYADIGCIDVRTDPSITRRYAINAALAKVSTDAPRLAPADFSAADTGPPEPKISSDTAAPPTPGPAARPPRRRGAS